MCTTLRSAEETAAWGEAYGRHVQAGEVLLLFGPLGAGKTTLVGGLARGLGYAGPVVSPTYTLLEVYDATVPLYHFDFYRIASPDELRSLDPREYFDAGISFIEWPERIAAWWPAARRELHIEFAGDARRLTERTIRPVNA